MSNIGHETAPPGSWPRPGEEAISEPGHKDVRETTPRFQPCMPESFDDTDSGPVDESQGSEGYTHTETETGKDTEATKPMKMGDEFSLHPAEEEPEMAEREKTEMLVKDKEKGPEMTQAGKEEMSEKKPETTVKENEEELGVKTTEQESGEKAMEERGEGLGMEKVGKEKMGGSDEMKDEGEPVGMKKPGEEDSSEMAPKKEGKDSSTKPEDEKMGETEKAKPEEEALGSKKPGEKGLGDMSMEEKGKGLGMEKVGEEMGAKPKEEIPEGEQAKEEIKKDEGEQAKEEIKKDEGEQAKEEIKEDEGEKEEVESPEEKEKREQAEADRKLASQMATVIEQCLDRIRPVCKTITGKIDKALATHPDERDEEEVVREVRPLIEEGGRILSEAHGAIRGLDPDGRIATKAKHKTALREGGTTPEEYRLAVALKELTGDVTNCIDDAKRKLENMPHAKKGLNPLWGLLNEPLAQILAGVGLLLAGVLNLVGKLLGGLGLGGLLDGLLGTLGLNRVLEGLGLGSLTAGLTGKKK